MAEVGVAQLAALTANINRDPKKGKAFTIRDFLVYHENEENARGRVSAQVAAVALSLRHEKRLPEILLVAWKDVLANAAEGTKPPEQRALHSDCGRVWVLAPSWEGANLRGGLVAVHGQLQGRLRLRDVDRPLLSYEVMLPARKCAGWLEAEVLLPKAPET